jgi:pimeloyl-ACP methyl ester carboxylesterase
MITNSTYRPKIASTAGYRAKQNGSVSLCHDYRIVLFDYPGVGRSPLNGEVTRDMIASDVDAMLQDAGRRYGIATTRVDPIGWSLGTTDALKYAFLSPVSRPSRIIGDIVLIATDPGGNTNGRTDADQAPCIASLFSASQKYSGSLGNQAGLDLLELTVPYTGQGPLDSGTNSGCTATVSGGAIDLSVEPDCTDGNGCNAFVADSLVNASTPPWRETQGISSSLFAQQRAQANDWEVAYCPHAGLQFTSEGCTSYGSIDQSVTNGGACKTDATKTNAPVSRDCAPLKLSGKLTVLNGHEDLFIQWKYGASLVAGYGRQLGSNRVALHTISEPAGHGVLYQHPQWVQDEIERAISGS